MGCIASFLNSVINQKEDQSQGFCPETRGERGPNPSGNSRQGCNPAGESPVLPVARLKRMEDWAVGLRFHFAFELIST